MKNFKILLLFIIGFLVSCIENDETVDITVLITDFTITIDENPDIDLSLGIIEAFTNQGELTFSIIEQSPDDAIAINPSTGELTIIDENLFDFETNPIITATVKVENGDISATADITINLNDISEISITASDFTTTIDEKPSIGLSLGTIEASTNQGTLTYSFIEQLPNDAIAINSSTGELTVLNEDLFDFEVNPTIIATVKIENEDVFETVNVTINLNDVEEITITAYDLEINLENIPQKDDFLGSIEAVTNQGSVTFQILEQNQNEVLRVDAITGNLWFNYFDNSFFNGNMPMLTAVVRVSNGDIYQDILVTVNLTLVCETTQEPLLLAFYPMNSNAMDNSVYDNHGTVNGPILTEDRFSNPDSAYYFNGIDDEITVPDNNQIRLTDEFTISAWVFPEEIKTQIIIRKGANVNGIYATPFALSMSADNHILFSITTNGVLKQAKTKGYETNVWYLITGVFKNQSMYLYVNNKLLAIETVEGDFNYNDLPLIIGTRLNLPSSTFKGVIDDIRIYDRALCGEEITQLYEN